MYKIRKAKSTHSNVFIENTETKANMILGGINIEMLSILEKAGYKAEDDTLVLANEWNFNIDTETANRLLATTMKIEKPIRTKKVDAPKTKNNNKEIDALDVLLGRAKYV